MKAFIPLLLAGTFVLFTSAGGPPYDGGRPKGGAGIIDLDDLPNYAAQAVPAYILRDNTPPGNPITDAGATLGRVLFHDKQLSSNGTVSCASCHQQAHAFGDPALASVGVNGATARHSMRLINARFAQEVRFFWDERAVDLEEQTTMPIRDHAEMGFSGTQGDPGFDSLITRMVTLPYYAPLFTAAFGDATITEARMQDALAQFVRSIQSFDSRFDEGRALVAANGAPFPNFTPQENAGKQLFLAPPQFNAQGQRIGGGAGCQGCHRAPEFDIDPNSGNNGVLGSIGGGADLTNTRSPSLRDVVKPDGSPNGPFFHNGLTPTLGGVIAHYDNMPGPSLDPLLDPRLMPGGNLQRLQLTPQEVNELIAFLRTLTGSDVYTNAKWSDPFLDGQLEVVGGGVGMAERPSSPTFMLWPSPTSGPLRLDLPPGSMGSPFTVIDMRGATHMEGRTTERLDVGALPAGTYMLRIGNAGVRFVKH